MCQMLGESVGICIDKCCVIANVGFQVTVSSGGIHRPDGPL